MEHNKENDGMFSSSSGQEREIDFSINIREVVSILRRRRKIIFSIMVGMVVLALLFLVTQTPQYTAAGVIQLDVRSKKVVNIESLIAGLRTDESAIQSEVDMLRSRSLVVGVLDRLHLMEDKEFNKEAGEGTFFGFKKKLEDLSDEEQKAKKQKLYTNAVDIFLKKLQVTRNPKSYTINISFESNNPEKAAQIVNTLIDEYFVSQLKSKFDATKRANEWLNRKMEDLQKEVRMSELAVQAFQEKHGLIETAGLTINEQQLSELNTQLILARTARAQAEAKLKSTIGSVESAAEVLSSSLIQNLRQQEAEVLRKRSEMTQRYGSRHPKIIDVNAELRDLRSKIDLEIKKIIAGLEKDMEVAKVREQSLDASLNQLQMKSGVSTKAKIELAEFIRERDADKMLYESFLTRSKEMQSGQDLEQNDAKIISAAEPPLKPSYPRKGITLGIALIIGCGLGVIGAFLIEYLDNTFRSSEQFENITQVPALGIMPELPAKTVLVNYVTTKPSSVFVESLRSIVASIHFSHKGEAPKTILITSSIPKEGKTSFAIALATMMAKSGKKILLVDCDLKKPAIAMRIGLKEVVYGLKDYLADQATVEQVIHIDQRSGLHFISAHANTVNSQDMLGSAKMRDFLEKMKKNYDCIIVDSPPVIAVSDALVMAKMMDTVLVAVHWDKTPRQLVKTTLSQLKFANAKIAGAVLTRVDVEKQNKFEYGERGYYYQQYKEYYLK